MNISKFLLIDAALAIPVILVLFLLKGRNQQSSLPHSSYKEGFLGKTSINFPNKEKLLDLEKHAKSKGSGIEFDSLIGVWRFESLWRKDTEDVDSIFSSLLRVFSAKLELKKDISPLRPLALYIIVSIQFGLLSIKFSGLGYLKGEQPCLHFFLNLIEVKLGTAVLLRRSIKEVVEKGKSFFAFIALDDSEGWLSARGQGDSLILWLKD